MVTAEGILDEVARALAVKIKAAVPELRAVTEGFPEANQTLLYPCVTIIATPGTHSHRQPAVLSKTAPVANKTKVKYVVGNHDWNLQVDLWCGNKNERSRLYRKIAEAFSQPPVLGLSLTLTGYHGIVCRYNLTDHRYEDSERASQTKEFRAILTVLADCDEVIEKEEFAIVTTEVTLETPDLIP